MRARAVRTAADDDEVRALVPLLDHRRRDVRADLRLGPPGAQPIADASMNAIDRGSRLAQRLDLGGILPHPQLAHDRPGQHLLGVGQRFAQREHMQRRGEVADRDAGRLAQPGRRHGVRVVAVDPGQHLDAELVHRYVAEPGCLQLRYDERRVAVGGDDERGEPLERTAGLTDQIAQIRTGRDQQPGTGRGLSCTVQSSAQNSGIGSVEVQRSSRHGTDTMRALRNCRSQLLELPL